MSLELSYTHGKPTVKTWGFMNNKDIVIFGDYNVDINDFFAMVYYVLTNTDLYKGDPRIKFVKKIKKLRKVKGYMVGEEHFQ